MNLTTRQIQVLGVIQSWIGEHGMPPTRAEIARELGFRSTNAAEEHLRALAKKGAIVLTRGISRGIRICA
jgi:repressor LexA